MKRQLGWVKVFQPTTATFSGVQCRIYKDPQDPAYDDKLTGMKVGLARVTAQGFTFPNGVAFYCTNMAGVYSIAFHRGVDGTREAAVLLGAASVDASNPGMYDGIAHKVAPLGGANYCAAVVVHELGHNLHERANEGFFWDGADAGGAEPLANQVSNYATKNKLEFVAEVFTGRMYGRNYSAQVMAQYGAYGGPTAANFP
jgi:hypothetical protein